MKKRTRFLLLLAGAIAAFCFLNNTNLLSNREGTPVLLAHRGIAQRYDLAGVAGDTCTATRILPPRHRYLENTIASMKASFDAGADIVEIDVHPTTDGQFAVFHDWTLECRTNGQGVTREHSMAQLKQLDIGFGYTHDGGKTYPLRGTGIGMMPSLAEVLDAFPGRRFLVNVKSNDPEEGIRLASYIDTLAPARRAGIMVYGGDRPIAAMRASNPHLKLMSRASLKSCLLRYAAYGWTGAMPQACRSTVLFVPVNIAPWLWGWPDRFLDRVEAAGSAAFVIGPYHGGEFSSGIDTLADLARLPPRYSGGILTNEIETIARVARGN